MISSVGNEQSIIIRNMIYSGKKISSGDTVSVKVLKSLGNDRYQVSFFGSRINVRSRIPLAEGSSFSAAVEVNGSKILLKPRIEQASADSAARLTGFLSSMGMTPDPVTMRILQQMIQSGVKIDRLLMQRAKAASLNFPGKESIAAETAALLLEKGIEPTEDNISKLLVLMETEKNPQDRKRKKNRENESDKENFLERLYSEIPEGKDGILSIVNHLKSKNSTGRHWIILPYCWDSDGKEAKGIIRILLDFNQKKTEKIQINCETECKKYFFVLYFKYNKVKEVRFCTLPPPLTSDIHSEEERLGELFCSGMNESSVTVTYSALAFSDGLFTGSENSLPFEDFSV